ncbi:hypothetical protein B0E42_12880 [Pseudomonas sp. A25(2017)]|uniref:hypothetical protein n=1 Tax=Pseudomonas sp. A25(2017) TaxID=1945865 RepID=UPI0009862504|nr:hypothetical protein [Pseudomonas sp. A25(2017)]OOG85692.1 hypothetical protein B0E42_12880 [Pseudomonas sp. A25(2017)]
MTDQTQRLEIATVRAEVGSNILSRFSNDAIGAGGIPTESGDIKNLKLIIKEIEDKASVSSSIYPTVAAGLAETVEGGIFLVASAEDDEIYAVWKKVGGVAVDTGKRTLSSQAVEDATEAAQASATASAASALAAQSAAANAAEDFQEIFDADQAAREIEFNDFMNSIGFESIYLLYGAGIVVERQTQLVQRDGELYRVMNASDIPLTLTGTWATDAPKLEAMGDAVLRQDLINGDGSLVGMDGGTNLKAWGSHLRFPEQFASLQAWAASGGSLGIKGGTYSVSSEIAFPFGTQLHTFGDVILDASAAVTLGNFPNSCAVRLGGGSFSAMPALSINYLKGAIFLTFIAPHGLGVGSVFSIYNPTDFSFCSFRSYYRAGEFCRVAAVISPTQVRLTKPLYTGYTAAAVNLYKMNGGSFALHGSLKVIAPEALASVMAVRAQRLIDFNITGLKGYSKQSSAAIELEKCFNGEGHSLVAEQGLLSGTGNDYGLIFSNCQHMRMEGYFSASRHGITTGGYGDIGSVPCREIECSGTATTTFEGSAHAVDTHGNTEYFTFKGNIYGGFDGGGNHITVKGNVFAADDGIAFYHAEMTGYDRDYSGVRVYSDTDPAAASRGVIDLGGNNTSSAAADTVGGVFDCSGMVVYAPAAMSIFKLIQRNSVASNIRVKLDGAQVAQAAAGYESVRATHSGGTAFARTSMAGFEAPGEAAQVHTASELTGVFASGFVDISVTTAQASANAVVNFPVGIFKDAPNVTASANTTSLGSTSVSANTNTPTVSSVTVTVKTGSLGNFGAAGTVRVFWRASTAR